MIGTILFIILTVPTVILLYFLNQAKVGKIDLYGFFGFFSYLERLIFGNIAILKAIALFTPLSTHLGVVGYRNYTGYYEFLKQKKEFFIQFNKIPEKTLLNTSQNKAIKYFNLSSKTTNTIFLLAKRYNKLYKIVTLQYAFIITFIFGFLWRILMI